MTVPLTVMQDFSANSATPSQTVKAGQTTGTYQLTISPAPDGFVLPQPRDTLLPHWAAFRSAVQVHSEGHHSGGNAPNVVMILSTVLHPEASNAGPLFMHCGWLCP